MIRLVSNISAGPQSGAPTIGASRALCVVFTVLLTVPSVLMPYEITFDHQTFQLHAKAALAKDAGKGGGNGNGNGNGQGGGNGNANGRGNDNGQGGPNGNGNGQGSANGNANGQANGSDNVTGGAVKPSAAEARENAEIGTNEVHHPNGMTEEVTGGRYVMKDAKGRTIINREATRPDLLRLRSFAQ